MSAEPNEVVIPVPENRAGPKPIIPILSQMLGGRLFDQMSVELARLVTDVIHHADGKGAKLILELSIDKPNAKLHLAGREIMLTANIKAKAPDDPPAAHLFYFDDDGGLHLSDPYQSKLFPGPR